MQKQQNGATNATHICDNYRRARVPKRAHANTSSPARSPKANIVRLRQEEAVLQEEIRQLTAAVKVYQDIVKTLSARAALINSGRALA